jgi:hypothetical protein
VLIQARFTHADNEYNDSEKNPLSTRPTMSTYVLKRGIPACTVKLALLQTLEGIILQKVSDLGGDRAHRPYSVTIKGDNSRHEFYRVEEVRFPLPGDTNSLMLEYRGRNLQIKVEFGLGPSGFLSIHESEYEIGYTGNSADEVAHSIANLISKEIERFPHAIFIRRRRDFPFALMIVAALIVFGTLNGVRAISDKENVEAFNGAMIMLSIGGALAIYCYFAYCIPHCLFDTLRNDSTVDAARRAWYLVVGWVVFTVGGGFLIRHFLN